MTILYKLLNQTYHNLTYQTDTITSVISFHFPTELTCVTCRGILGSTCHLNADQVVHTESCDKCAVFARLQTTG